MILSRAAAAMPQLRSYDMRPDEEELDADQPEPLKTSGCLWMRFNASSNLDPELEETPTGFVLRVTQAAGDEDRVVALRVDEEEDAQAWMQW